MAAPETVVDLEMVEVESVVCDLDLAESELTPVVGKGAVLL